MGGGFLFFFYIYFFIYFLFGCFLAGEMGVASQYGNRFTSGNGGGGSITASAKKNEGEAFG